MDVNIDDICHTVIFYYFLAADSAFRAQLHGTSISGTKELLIDNVVFIM